MKPTLLLVLDTRSEKKSGKYPVKLRITYNRKSKYIATGYDMVESEWANLNGGDKLSRKEKEIKETLIGIQGKAQGVIDDMKFFNFVAFDKLFYKNRTSEGTLFNQYEEYIKRLTEEERLGTASSYQCSLNSLKEYKAKIDFEQVTPEFLNGYEKWMTGKDKSVTTVGIYLRALRTIFNEAISAGLIAKEMYPFGKRKYEIPSGRNIKKALTLVDVNKIFKFKTPKGSTAQRSKDFWMFCYLCNGINIKDILLLKFKNLAGDHIEFVRAKTQRSTKTNQKPISIYLLPETKQIIERWGNPDRLPDSYIFPILSNEMTAEKQRAVIQQFTKTVNKYIQRIASDLKIEKHVTTYTARHTFSTVLKRSGASTEFISEALGHSNKKTTESYLDSFEKETQKEYAKKLVAF
jgi:integrase/recombinase XerD